MDREYTPEQLARMHHLASVFDPAKYDEALALTTEGSPARLLSLLAILGAESPEQQWEKLRTTFLTEIGRIDQQVPWSEIEPDWWVQMLATDRFIRARKVS